MSKRFKIILIASLLINIFFIIIEFLEYRSRQINLELTKPFVLKDVNVTEEKKKFLSKFRREYPSLADKKYVFINFWTGGSGSCIAQLPILDTLLMPLRDDMAYLVVSDENPNYATRRLRGEKISTANFTYINQSDSLIHAICKEKKVKAHTWGFVMMLPMNIVLDRTGNIVYFDTLNALSGEKKDSLKDREIASALKTGISNLK